MENIKLENGLFLNRQYGKYLPNLTFISKYMMNKEWEQVIKCGSGVYTTADFKDLNTGKIYWGGFTYIVNPSCEALLGDKFYFKSPDGISHKLGNSCFLTEKEFEEQVKKEYSYTHPKIEVILTHETIEPAYKVVVEPKTVGQDFFSTNLDGRKIRLLEGQYRKSQKGTDVFDLTKSGDYLIEITWGWSHNKTRGDVQGLEDVKYYRRARSGGGKAGYTYLVVPKNWKYFTSEVKKELLSYLHFFNHI